MDPTLTPIDPNLQVIISLLGSVPYTAKVLPWLPLVFMVAAGIDIVFKAPPAGSILVWPWKVVHFLAGNFGNARNAVPAGAVPASIAQKVQEVQQSATALETRVGELAERADGQPEAKATPETLNKG